MRYGARSAARRHAHAVYLLRQDRTGCIYSVQQLHSVDDEYKQQSNPNQIGEKFSTQRSTSAPIASSDASNPKFANNNNNNTRIDRNPEEKAPEVGFINRDFRQPETTHYDEVRGPSMEGLLPALPWSD